MNKPQGNINDLIYSDPSKGSRVSRFFSFLFLFSLLALIYNVVSSLSTIFYELKPQDVNYFAIIVWIIVAILSIIFGTWTAEIKDKGFWKSLWLFSGKAYTLSDTDTVVDLFRYADKTFKTFSLSEGIIISLKKMIREKMQENNNRQKLLHYIKELRNRVIKIYRSQSNFSLLSLDDKLLLAESKILGFIYEKKYKVNVIEDLDKIEYE